MKKAMLFIVAMMFTAAVNAASLNLSEFGTSSASIVGQDTGSVTATGVLEDRGIAGKFWALFDVEADTATSIMVSTALSPFSATDIDIFKVDGNVVSLVEMFNANLGSVSFAALAGATYRILLNSTTQKGYILNVQAQAVPVPAALFLLAPVLLGFLGLRRKATLAA